jgi:hypothetical protein
LRRALTPQSPRRNRGPTTTNRPRKMTWFCHSDRSDESLVDFRTRKQKKQRFLASRGMRVLWFRGLSKPPHHASCGHRATRMFGRKSHAAANFQKLAASPRCRACSR